MSSDSHSAHRAPAPYMNPYLAGIGLGLVLLASYLALIALGIVSLLFITRLSIPPMRVEHGEGPSRPLWEIIRQPVYLTALACFWIDNCWRCCTV